MATIVAQQAVVAEELRAEQFFFGLLKECLEKGIISESLVEDEMRQNHVRHDALQVAERTPPLAA